MCICRERLETDDEQIVDELIKKVLLAISTGERTHDAPVVVAIEAGGSTKYEAGKFERFGREVGIREIIMLAERKDQKIGTRKDPGITDNFVSDMRHALTYNEVCIADDCVSISSSLAKPPPTMEDQCRELRSEFMRFRYDRKKHKIHGKDGKDNNDDLMIALLMGIHWGIFFINSANPTYCEFKRKFPALAPYAYVT